MKKLNYFNFSILFVLFVFVSNSNGQKNIFVAGVEGAYLSPIGTLSTRWVGSPGYSVYFGIKTNETWTWTGKMEYFTFNKQNTSKLNIIDIEAIGSESYTFNLPIPNLKQDITVYGLSVNAKYNVYRSSLLEANVDLGFGIYRWNYNRSSHDSLALDTTLSGTKYHFLVLAPQLQNTQEDWSGGFNIGVEFVVKLIDPIEWSISGSYKNIVGELFPALSFDIENVATFQMLDFRTGIRFKF